MPDANARVVERLLKSAPADSLVAGAQIVSVAETAELWAGYGSICTVVLKLKLKLKDQNEQEGQRRFILKVIIPPRTELDSDGKPDEGHLRKLLSYRVEANFYGSRMTRSLQASLVCGPHASISTLHSALDAPVPGSPRDDGSDSRNEAASVQAILLDDIRDIGFPRLAEEMRGTLDQDQTLAALRWLAHFHAHFAGYLPNSQDGRAEGDHGECPPPLKAWSSSSSSSRWKGNGVWQMGGYNNSLWARLGLKGDLAHAIDWALSAEGSHCGPAGQTLIHGDVKSANLAFSDDGRCAAAYDFQFVGRGVGVTDLAKFLTTSISSSAMDSQGERTLLRYYHDHFISAVQAEPAPLWAQADDTGFLPESRRAASAYSFDDFLIHWDLAILSWQRFQAGWGAWGNVQWTQRRAKEILERPGWSAALVLRWKHRQAQ
ncbi:unnamed protein product [Tilletia controversa]|nr:unnamed protein product [Tilletia caries]CAD6962937.1 unnamed protein product [Tilletia controversa]